MKELSALGVSALCSNLARACEKMYKFDEEAKFKELVAISKQVLSLLIIQVMKSC